MKALCPDLAKKIGDDKLMAVINAKLTATQGGTATYDFDPSILTDLDKFFSQVLPLYSYQMSNRMPLRKTWTEPILPIKFTKPLKMAATMV